MISAIGTALTAVIGWVGEVVDALTGTSGELAALLPLLAITVAVSGFAFAIKSIRSLIFGA